MHATEIEKIQYIYVNVINIMLCIWDTAVGSSGVHAYKWSATGYTTFAVSGVDVGGVCV